MKVQDVMSRPAIYLRPKVPAHVAAALLVSHGITAAPVLDAEGRLIGMTTEVNLVDGRIARDAVTIHDLPGLTVADVMTAPPIVARSDDDLADMVRLMIDTGVRSVPVVDDGRLNGMLSLRDALQLVAWCHLIAADLSSRRVTAPPVTPEVADAGAVPGVADAGAARY